MAAQQSVELILVRQLASHLAVPILLLDPKGEILFFNEPAEELAGKRFSEIGRMGFEEWSAIVRATDDDGRPLELHERIVPRALDRGEPAHRRYWLTDARGQRRHIEGTALPLVRPSGEMLGVLAMFWEIKEP